MNIPWSFCGEDLLLSTEGTELQIRHLSPHKPESGYIFINEEHSLRWTEKNTATNWEVKWHSSRERQNTLSTRFRWGHGSAFFLSSSLAFFSFDINRKRAGVHKNTLSFVEKSYSAKLKLEMGFWIGVFSFVFPLFNNTDGTAFKEYPRCFRRCPLVRLGFGPDCIEEAME